MTDEVHPADTPSAAESVPQRSGPRSLRKVFIGPPWPPCRLESSYFRLILFAVGFCLRPLGKLSGPVNRELPVPPARRSFYELLRALAVHRDRYHSQVYRSQAVGLFWNPFPCVSLLVSGSGRHRGFGVGDHTERISAVAFSTCPIAVVHAPRSASGICSPNPRITPNGGRLRRVALRLRVPRSWDSVLTHRRPRSVDNGM